MTPPSSGPSATPSPAIDDHRPSAAVRRSIGNAADSRVSVSGIRSAAPSPWTARASDELREVVGERARGRGRREHEQPDDEHAAAAVAIAERGSRQDEDGEREDVRVDDPLQPIDRDTEVALHRRDAPRRRSGC